MIWETYRDEFNRNRLKLSETETVNPREDLTEQTAPAPVTLILSMPVYSAGTEASEKVNARLNIIIYVLKPVCVYSRDALLTIIYHLGIIYNFKFNRNETSRDI